jgi:hypothetical protein
MQGAMSNHSSPLSRKELAEAEELERLLKLQISRPERESVALEYVLSFALEMFDLYNEVYAKGTYNTAAAASEAKARATFRISTCMEQNRFFRDTEQKRLYIGKIEEAIDQKISRLPSGLRDLLAPPTQLTASPLLLMAARTRIGSLANQLHALKNESRLTFEEIAQGIQLDLRSVKRHFSGETKPRNKQIRAYEVFFTQAFSRVVRISTTLMSL